MKLFQSEIFFENPEETAALDKSVTQRRTIMKFMI